MLSVAEIRETDDVDALWRTFMAAREAGDAATARAAENRMRALEPGRRFAHLSDDELASRITALGAQREAKDMLAHAPGGGSAGDNGGGEDTAMLNQRIRQNQHVGIEETLSALTDEQARRRTT